MRFAVGGSGTRLRLPCLVLLALAPLAQAQVVIYRCTDASGAVTFQNDKPCAKGSTEVKRVVAPAPQQSRTQFLSGTAGAAAAAPVAATASPPAASMPPAAAVAPAPDPAATGPDPVPATTAPPTALDAGSRLPPPPLFECRTWEGHRYLGDEAQPAPRCVPLAVTGLDGSDSTSAGSACQMVDDQCQPVPDALLCEGWTQRLNDVESQSVGGGDNRAYAQAEAGRLRAVIEASNCAKP
ncbi:MAG TPA: DUF4124 domain-containing protein [Lysobacter sp.]